MYHNTKSNKTSTTHQNSPYNQRRTTTKKNSTKPISVQQRLQQEAANHPLCHNNNNNNENHDKVTLTRLSQYFRQVLRLLLSFLRLGDDLRRKPIQGATLHSTQRHERELTHATTRTKTILRTTIVSTLLRTRSCFITEVGNTNDGRTTMATDDNNVYTESWRTSSHDSHLSPSTTYIQYKEIQKNNNNYYAAWRRSKTTRTQSWMNDYNEKK
eukprot:6483190-Amphidinium_carterae.1